MAPTTPMRMAPRSPAVESFLRNFEHERLRLQEVLEVTLCYGVFCLSQNYSLKGMSVEELHAVTRALHVMFILIHTVARLAY